LTVYLAKQRKFKSLIKSIQNSLSTKSYKKQGYTFQAFAKKYWNISRARKHFKIYEWYIYIYIKLVLFLFLNIKYIKIYVFLFKIL